MAQVIADVVKGHMEKVRRKFPMLLEMEEFACQKVKRASERHRITITPNSADFRAPFIYQPPAEAGIFSSAGGSLGGGSGYKADQFTQTAKEFKLGVGLDQKVISATKDGALAVKNALKENMRLATKSFRFMEDTMWHNQTGTQGLLAEATAVSSNTYTCDSEWGVNLLQVGQPCEIFVNGLGTHRTSGVTPDSLPVVTALNKNSRTVTFDDLSGLTTSATDYLAFQGVGTTPASHQGLYAVNNSATTGTLNGINRATIPEINSNPVSGSSGLSFELGFQVRAKIEQRRGSIPTLTGFAAPAQLLAIHQLGIAISQWNRGASDKMIDILPADAKTLPFCGMTIHRDIHSSKKRIDFTNLKNWCRVYIEEVDYYKDLNGNMFFEGRNSAGTVIARHFFYLWCYYNYLNVDPADGYIHSLPIPSGM